MIAFIALGKHGDQVSVLPILHAEFLRTGVKPVMVVSAAYQAIPRRAPYVEAALYPGDSADLAGAIRWAKTQWPQVVPLSVYGTNYPIQHRHPSFQYDSWDRGGALAMWESAPLAMDRSKAAVKAAETLIGKEPTILIGDQSGSSPFLEIEDLVAALAVEFTTHKIVRLSSLKLPNVADLLAVYDRAAVLVSVETVHLHLAKASKIPIVALVTDTPSRWHGSAWHPRFALHVRYSSYQQRKAQIIDAVRNALANKSAPAITPMPHAPLLAYNSSQMRVGDKLWTTWRHHPDPRSWRTELTLHDGESAFPLTVDGLEQFSHEDARLFMFRGKPHVSLTLSRSGTQGQSFSPCATGCGELVREDKAWRIRDFIRPAYEQNNWDGQVKNLAFFDWAGKLYCIWRVSPEHTVLELDGSRVAQVFKTPCPTCSFGEPRGGTQPIERSGNWLRFFHANQVNPKSDQPWTYSLGALEMEVKPPFRVLKVSSKPILTGAERYFPGHKFWKPRVLIVYGAIPRGDGFELSCGVNDSQCATVLLKEEDLNL